MGACCWSPPPCTYELASHSNLVTPPSLLPPLLTPQPFWLAWRRHGRVHGAVQEFLFPRSECLAGTFTDTGTGGGATGDLQRSRCVRHGRWGGL